MTITDALDIAIRIGRVLAPRTSTQWDDLAITALESLRNSEEFIRLLEQLLGQGSDIPEGAMAISGVTLSQLTAIPEAQNLDLGTLLSLLKFLPELIAIIKELLGR